MLKEISGYSFKNTFLNGFFSFLAQVLLTNFFEEQIFYFFLGEENAHFFKIK